MAKGAFLEWQLEARAGPQASQRAQGSRVCQTPSHLGYPYLQWECRNLMPAQTPRWAHLRFTAFSSSCLLCLSAVKARNRRILVVFKWKALPAEKGKEYLNFKCSCVIAGLSSKQVVTVVWHTFGAYRIEAPMRCGGTVITENIAGFASNSLNSSRKYSIILSLYIFQLI